MSNRTKVSYYVKPPDAKRGSKRFYIYSRGPNGTKRVNTPDLDPINREYLAGNLTLDQAKAKTSHILERLKASRHHWNKTNVDALERYWESEYKGRDISAPKAAYNRLRRGIEAVGGTSLLTATREELEALIWDKPQQRTLAQALNQILRFLGRSVHLRSRHAPRPKIHYIQLKDWPDLRKKIELDYGWEARAYFGAAFATGARPWEVLAIKENNVVETPLGTLVHILTQFTDDLKETETKTREVRRAAVISELLPELLDWVKVPDEWRIAAHKVNWAERARTLTDKRLRKFKDLRHSYAVHLVSKGVTLKMVADSLGNSVAVCERYYAGMQLTEAGMVEVLSKI